MKNTQREKNPYGRFTLNNIEALKYDKPRPTAGNYILLPLGIYRPSKRAQCIDLPKVYIGFCTLFILCVYIVKAFGVEYYTVHVDILHSLLLLRFLFVAFFYIF